MKEMRLKKIKTLVVTTIISQLLALSWKNASTNVISCEHEDVRLTWEYELHPGEYVKAKTWFAGQKEIAKVIAYWKDTDGLKISPEYIKRVTMIGNDYLLLKDVTTSDNGQYTLIVNFPLSPDPDPRLTLNLTVYVPPPEGCCKPTIHQLENRTGLRADLHRQACGTGPLHLKWRNASGTTANGDVLVFESTEVTGTFTVCVAGPTMEICFKGRSESLCQETYIAEKMCEVPKIKEQDSTVIAVLTTLGTLIVLTESVALILVLNWRRINTYRKRNKNRKFPRASLKVDDDGIMLVSPILPEEEKMDKATMEISHTMYIVYNRGKELSLQKMKPGCTAIENSEIRYIDNVSYKEEEAVLLTANHETKVSNPSYVQCVYHKDKLIKLLILQEDVGIGITDWCRKFVKIWCEGYERKYLGISIQEESEEIRTLYSFHLLFVVSLRHVEKGQTLKDIIKQQCMEGMNIQNGDLYDILDSLMRKRPEKLIFIFHGADETNEKLSILSEIVSETRNSLKILTCRDWEPLQSKYGIRDEDYQPMAYVTLKHIDTQNI